MVGLLLNYELEKYGSKCRGKFQDNIWDFKCRGKPRISLRKVGVPAEFEPGNLTNTSQKATCLVSYCKYTNTRFITDCVNF